MSAEIARDRTKLINSNRKAIKRAEVWPIVIYASEGHTKRRIKFDDKKNE